MNSEGRPHHAVDSLTDLANSKFDDNLDGRSMWPIEDLLCSLLNLLGLELVLGFSYSNLGIPVDDSDTNNVVSVVNQFVNQILQCECRIVGLVRPAEIRSRRLCADVGFVLRY